MEDKELLVIEAMRKYGGSFVKALAECFVHADGVNFEKLRETFSNYWNHYSKVAEERRDFLKVNK